MCFFRKIDITVKFEPQKFSAIFKIKEKLFKSCSQRDLSDTKHSRKWWQNRS